MSLAGYRSEAPAQFFPPAVPLPIVPHVPAPEAVQEQLNRIVSSKTFVRSKDLCRFLQFVVEQTLRNRAVRLKEYLIGISVFRRGENFNPGVDPIVRVQARRLRSKLDQYYETEGWTDTVRIDLPSGRYVPVFRHRPSTAAKRSLAAPEPGRSSHLAAPAEALSAIQEEVSHAVADVLRPYFSERAAFNPADTPEEQDEAHQLCHQGDEKLLEPTPDAVREAIKCFEHAAASDPNHVPAYTGLAAAYAAAGMTGLFPLNAAMKHVRSLAAKALALDGRSAAARAAHALTAAFNDWDFRTAGRFFREAQDLAPGLALTHHWHAIGGLLPFGLMDRAILGLRIALEFAPRSIALQTDLAWALCLDRRFEEASARSRAVLDAAPGFFRAHYVAGLIHELQGQFTSALAHYDLAATLTNGSVIPAIAASQGYAAARADLHDRAQHQIESLINHSGSQGISLAVATIYMGLGRVEQIFEWLHKAVEEHDAQQIWLNVDPRFAPMRLDLRFERILSRLHLAPERTELD